jgi:hypothetical protein
MQLHVYMAWCINSFSNVTSLSRMHTIYRPYHMHAERRACGHEIRGCRCVPSNVRNQKYMKLSFHYSKYITTIVCNGSEKIQKYRLKTKYIYLLRAIYTAKYNDIYMYIPTN